MISDLPERLKRMSEQLAVKVEHEYTDSPQATRSDLRGLSLELMACSEAAADLREAARPKTPREQEATILPWSPKRPGIRRNPDPPRAA